MILWALLALLLSTSSQKGLDVLALARTDPTILIDNVDNNYAIGVLDVSFGDPYPNLKLLLDSKKFTSVRMHLLNGTANNHRCVWPVNGTTELLKRAKKLKSFADNYPDIKWYVSPVLESGCISKPLINSWFDTLRKVSKTFIPVCSSIVGNCPRNVLIEIHGNDKVVADIRSNDGNSILDADMFYYNRSARKIRFGWIPCMNGRKPGQINPPLSGRQNWCKEADIKQVVKLLRK
jgi:hypothetical protein